MTRDGSLEDKTPLDRMIDLAVAVPPNPKVNGKSKKQVQTQPPKGDAPFRARVVYVIPPMNELKRRFPIFFDPAYDNPTFKPIKDCEKVSRETREVEFEYVCLNRSASTDSVLNEIKKRGLRPAFPEELIAFAEKYPDEQRKFPIIALGSEAHIDGDRGVASLGDGGHGRRLDLLWIEGDWYGGCQFLAVRQSGGAGSGFAG